MTEPKKAINFIKILPSFQGPGIAMGLTFAFAPWTRGAGGQPTTVLFKYKITHANDGPRPP
jgi:hypothetical protein